MGTRTKGKEVAKICLSRFLTCRSKGGEETIFRKTARCQKHTDE